MNKPSESIKKCTYKLAKNISLIMACVLTAMLFTACGSAASANKAITNASTASDSSASGSSANEKAIEINVFAAASLTETLQVIAENYKEVAPNVTITLSLGSSGDLVKQIKEGADCDLFISAGMKQMNQLDGTKGADDGNSDGIDMILPESRINLLENKIALIVTDENAAGIDSFDTLAEKLKEGSIVMAMGGADVPAGEYTDKILSYYNLDKDALLSSGSITLADDVKIITSIVKEASVDCGVVYATDAFSADVTVADTATKDMCGQVIYPAAIINTTAHEAEVAAFLEYLQSADCGSVFEAVGFTPIAG